MASLIRLETISLLFSFFLIQIAHSRFFDKSRSLDIIKKNSDDLPICNNDLSVCGMVQYNNFGTYSQPLCRCKDDFNPEFNALTSGSSCPLRWDPNDGQTHIHAFDQYKFCGTAPKLEQCKLDQPAYLTLNRIDRLTSARLENTHLLLCKCPVGHILIQDNKNIKFLELERQSVQIIHHICSPAPICEEDQVCAAVTQTTNNTLVRKNCRCPLGMFSLPS